MQNSDKVLRVLGRLSYFESTGDYYLKESEFLEFVYPTKAGSRAFRLFKILQTNFCEGDCKYCINRKYRNTERYYLTPLKLARAFMEYYKRKKVDGLFLSSGIFKSSNFMQEKMLETVLILRKKFSYRGFIHLKVLPGVDLELIKKIIGLVDRVSINIEAPTQSLFSTLTTTKDFKEGVLKRLQFLSQLNKNKIFRSGVITQMIVGFSKERDLEILKTVYFLYKNFNLRRVYYSGFVPVKETPLQNQPACSLKRELRIYQADVLLRKYGFSVKDLVFDKEGNLPLYNDPKTLYTLTHPELFPININKADFKELLKIPGIGTITAKRILNVRKEKRIVNLEELTKLGVDTKRAKNYVKF